MPGPAAGIRGQSGHAQPAEVAEGSGHDQAQAADQHGQRAAGRGDRPVVDPGSQHRGPESHQRAGDGKPDPAKEVDHGVGHQQPSVPGLRQVVAGQDGPQSGPDGQHRRRGHVVAHAHAAEPRRQRTPAQQDERHTVPGHRAGDRHRTEQGEDSPDTRRHTDDDEGDPGVQQHKPSGLLRPRHGGVLGLQHGAGEVRAPHHDRVGYRAQDHHVDHEPAGCRDHGVDGHEDDGDGQPEDRRPVPHGPGTPGTSGRIIHGNYCINWVHAPQTGRRLNRTHATTRCAVKPARRHRARSAALGQPHVECGVGNRFSAPSRASGRECRHQRPPGRPGCGRRCRGA